MPLSPKHIPMKRVGRATVPEGPWRLRTKHDINLRSYGAHFRLGVAEDVSGANLRRLCAALGPRLAFAELLDVSGRVRGILTPEGFSWGDQGAAPAAPSAPQTAPTDPAPPEADEEPESGDESDESGPHFVAVSREELLAMDKDELDDFAAEQGVKLDRRRKLETMVDDLVESGKVRLTD